MSRSWIVLASLFAILTIAADPIFGQARDTASLFGTVTDSQSAVVPGAKVTATNRATGSSRTVNTDASGAFNLPLLPVGTYSLTVEQPGFRKYRAHPTSCYKPMRTSRRTPSCRSATYRKR